MTKKKDKNKTPVAPPAPEQKPEKHAGGAPTQFKPEFSEMLVAHMAQGGSFEAFGAICKKCKQTLYNWLAVHPEWVEAKALGEVMSLRFYEEMGKNIAIGNMRRVTKETPVLDPDGKIVYDNKGNIVYHREYAGANTNAAVWIFMMKNMHGWRDKRELSGPDGGPIKFDHTNTDSELEAEYKRLLEKANGKHTDAGGKAATGTDKPRA